VCALRPDKKFKDGFMKFAIVLGTRPEIIKMAPIIKELERRKIELVLIHTGQHNLETLFKDLKIRNPDYVLDVPPMSVGKFKGNLFKGIFNAAYWSLMLSKSIRSVLKKERPDVLLYEGDTLAIASASIAGRLFLKRPVLGHVEAGLRTGDILNPFPEEISRRIADIFSDLLFAPTKGAAKNLDKLLIRGKVFMTGNTIVDAVTQHKKLSTKKRIKLPKKFGVVFIHRQENIHSKNNLLNLYHLLSNLEEKVIFLEHSSTMQKLKDFNLLEKFKKLENVEFRPLYDYLPFLKIMSKASYVITDSGGIQEEVCSLKVPCIIWRKKTERPEVIEAGAAVLVADDWKQALNHIEDIKKKDAFYKSVKKSKNPFGDGKSAKRIVDISLRYI